MPHPKHPNVPIQTDDGQEVDQDELLDEAEEENDPDKAAQEFDAAGADADEIDP